MTQFILNILFCVITLVIMHEFGHFLTAALNKKILKFEFKFVRIFNIIPIPRFIWYMPEDLTVNQQKLIAISGFGFEFVFCIVYLVLAHNIFSMLLLALAILHLLAYKFYAGDFNDFSIFKNN